MSEDAYLLKRDFFASVRLNAQHLLWIDTFGSILQPEIESAIKDWSEVEFADVGTGTGIVPLDLNTYLKQPPKALIGLDNSSDQFPPKRWLPENVDLRVVDVLSSHGIPEDLRERFDVVHARYLLSLVKKDPQELIKPFLQLLKPGGYLQWGEPMTSQMRIESADGASTEGLTGLAEVIVGICESSWLERLPAILEESGFEILVKERRSARPWTRNWYLDTWCALITEYGRGDPKIKDIVLNASAESKAGSYIELDMLCVVARKKA